jgi:outer membrane immunogenic protein
MGVTLKNLKLALLGATFLLGAAGVASAADVYQRGSIKDTGEAYLPAITWTGFYAGVHAGGAFGGEVEVDVEGDDTFDLDSAFTGGVHVGYNWQTPSNLVLGVEGSISLLGLEASDGNNPEFTDYVASLRGRLGYAFGDNLLYGTGGLAFVGYADDVADELEDDTELGFVVGGGWERKISDNVSFGVEGLYYNFESDDLAGNNVETDFWTVTARLNYHFNAGYADPLK